MLRPQKQHRTLDGFVSDLTNNKKPQERQVLQREEEPSSLLSVGVPVKAEQCGATYASMHVVSFSKKPLHTSARQYQITFCMF